MQQTAKTKPDAVEALALLKGGNKRFSQGRPQHIHTGFKRLDQCGREDQSDHAFATVITCSDSRVPAERIFDVGVMDIFVIRVAGNVFSPATIGSVEYGMTHIHTPLLVVLGHSQCGAVTATAQKYKNGSCAMGKHVRRLLDRIQPAVERVTAINQDAPVDELISNAIEENIWIGIETLFRESTAVRNMVRSGQSRVVGAVYDVGGGTINWLPEEKVINILNDFYY